jgi:hypothetical protein
MLQRLIEMAVELCGAMSPESTCWKATSFGGSQGPACSPRFENNTMPREASPCGVCIDQNATQLMYLADRLFLARALAVLIDDVEQTVNVHGLAQVGADALGWFVGAGIAGNDDYRNVPQNRILSSTL